MENEEFFLKSLTNEFLTAALLKQLLDSRGSAAKAIFKK